MMKIIKEFLEFRKAYNDFSFAELSEEEKYKIWNLDQKLLRKLYERALWQVFIRQLQNKQTNDFAIGYKIGLMTFLGYIQNEQNNKINKTRYEWE